MSKTKLPMKSGMKSPGPGTSKNRKRSEGSVAYRALQFYLHLLQAKTMVALKDFDASWGSSRRFLDIRNLLDDVFERETGRPLLEYLDEDGRPTSKKRRLYVRLAIPELRPPHPRNLSVFPLLAELFRPVARTSIGSQLEKVIEHNTSSLSNAEKSTLNRLGRKFYHHCTNGLLPDRLVGIVDEVIEALIREQTLTVTYREQDPARPSPAVIQPLMVALHQGTLLLVATHHHAGPKAAGAFVVPLSAFNSATWNRSDRFVGTSPGGLKELVAAYVAAL